MKTPTPTTPTMLALACSLRGWIAGTSTLALTACMSVPQGPVVPAPMVSPVAASSPLTTVSAGQGEAGLRVQTIAAPPAPVSRARGDAGPAAVTPGIDAKAVSAINLEQIALGSFAQIVFAEVLKKNVSVDSRVLARRDLVTFRTGGAQTAEQIESAVKLLLKTYGVSALDTGGLIRVVPDDASAAVFPEIRRGSANPETPASLRPIFHLVELQAVRPAEVSIWLRTVFGERVKTQEDPSRNALLVSGNTDNVTAALEAIRVLDQPVMAGRGSLALTPSYWSADDLARRLYDVLSAEGYVVQPVGTNLGSGTRSPIILLPVTALNSVFVFANSEALLSHIKGWAVRLDRPNERGIGRNFFTYAVKHKDASDLAKTLEQLLTGVRTTAAPQGQAGGAPAARGSSVVVDASSNMLIFQANPEEYSQLTALLQSLDKPAKSALIEVTVAELSVDNNSQLGVEWFFNQATAGGSTATGGTLGGLAIGSSGFTYKVVGSAGGSPRLLLNALAADNRATILSSPRISARNGETAVIQVGQEVPIITSQQSGSVGANNGALSVLQTVQYRSTGVILKVKPAIHSGDQIDLDVTQEVSAAQATTTGVSSSPTIGTRKFDTKLTLRNGSTVMLGGLISEESSGGNAGIPGFKDMPLLGNLFSNQTKKGLRRELIVLITPYVLNNQGDAEAITDAFRRSLGSWAGTATPSPRAAEPAASAVPAAPAK
ncbi:secretin N-terminal domain-containing protein [Roseateles sp.]|jgi:general secretion pathway protein D|uniref:secretin N-terminal domain-containing protein n=1 Tax=Roseateles sp. TaxID=1971397 RepID=UPI0037C53278